MPPLATVALAGVCVILGRVIFYLCEILISEALNFGFTNCRPKVPKGKIYSFLNPSSHLSSFTSNYSMSHCIRHRFRSLMNLSTRQTQYLDRHAQLGSYRRTIYMIKIFEKPHYAFELVFFEQVNWFLDGWNY